MSSTRKGKKDNESVVELFCEWTDCNEVFNNLTLYLQHLHKCHINGDNGDNEDNGSITLYSCQWIGCEENHFDNYSQFCLHVSYHGFHQKLMSNGLTVMKTLGDSINCFMDCSARNVLPELPKVFVCGWEQCFTDFTDSESFYRHVDRHAIEDVAIPSLSKDELKRTKFAKCLWIGCKSAFTSRPHLKEHLRTHTQEKLIACPSCGAMFCNKTKFIDHLHRQTSDTVTNKSDSFTIHVSKGDDTPMTTLTIQMPQTDDSSQIGLNSGTTSSILIQNLNSENELMLIDLTANSSLSTVDSTPGQKSSQTDKPFRCSVCWRQFATQSLLTEHSRIHINKYKCNECQMTTNSPSALKHHMSYRHSSNRPFSCQFCDLKFKSRSDLRRHIDTHSSEPPFRCSLCGFQSRSVHTFSKHNKEQHLAIKCHYECQQCKKRFSRGNNLTRHLITIHKYVLPVGSSRFQYEKQEDGIYRLSNKSMADNESQ